MAAARSIVVRDKNNVYRLTKTKWELAKNMLDAGDDVPWELMGTHLATIDFVVPAPPMAREPLQSDVSLQAEPTNEPAKPPAVPHEDEFH